MWAHTKNVQKHTHTHIGTSSLSCALRTNELSSVFLWISKAAVAGAIFVFFLLYFVWVQPTPCGVFSCSSFVFFGLHGLFCVQQTVTERRTSPLIVVTCLWHKYSPHVHAQTMKTSITTAVLRTYSTSRIRVMLQLAPKPKQRYICMFGVASHSALSTCLHSCIRACAIVCMFVLNREWNAELDRRHGLVLDEKPILHL